MKHYRVITTIHTFPKRPSVELFSGVDELEGEKPKNYHEHMSANITRYYNFFDTSAAAEHFLQFNANAYEVFTKKLNKERQQLNGQIRGQISMLEVK